MMTREEEANEFWLLTLAILEDSRVETSEAKVVMRWIQEHQRADEFAPQLAKLQKFMDDGYIDRFESKDIILSISSVLRRLRELAKDEAAGAAK